VEQGIAPGALLAVHTPQTSRNFGPGSMRETGVGSAPDMIRPIYPYPFTTQYTGKGDVNDPVNFVQGPRMKVPAETYNWLGASLYTPGYEKWCEGNGESFDCKNSR
jgi:hypothetical protein